jgi:hypothetical protein
MLRYKKLTSSLFYVGSRGRSNLSFPALRKAGIRKYRKLRKPLAVLMVRWMRPLISSMVPLVIRPWRKAMIPPGILGSFGRPFARGQAGFGWPAGATSGALARVLLQLLVESGEILCFAN